MHRWMWGVGNFELIVVFSISLILYGKHLPAFAEKVSTAVSNFFDDIFRR